MKGFARFVPILVALATAAVTPAWSTEVRFRGTLEVTAAERGDAYVNTILTRGDSPFDAYGLRLFADAQIHPRLAVFSQVVLRDAAVYPYVDGAYLMFTPSPSRDLHVLAGKIPWAIGTYGPRTYPEKNPLIGAPLMYQYHTSFMWWGPPASTDALLAAAGTGQYGIGYAYGSRGTPVIDDSYWDVGVTLTGSERPFEYAVGINNGTPGWGTTSQEEDAGKSFLGRLGVAPTPWLRAGVSGAWGPYLPHKQAPFLPAGKEVTDFNQKLVMADLEVSSGHVELHAEGARNFWETPLVGELGLTTAYAELKYSLPTGAWLAGRWDMMRFSEVTESTGERYPWDHDLTRIEAGVGYRFSREAFGKIVWQRIRFDDEEDEEDEYPAASMVAAQVVVQF
jgi:hypothetical protein